jgi:RHS repeat-associated protein
MIRFARVLRFHRCNEGFVRRLGSSKAGEQGLQRELRMNNCRHGLPLSLLFASLILSSGCTHKRSTATASYPPGAPAPQPSPTKGGGNTNPQAAVPPIPEPPAGGPGWRDGEYTNATLMDNRRGRDIHRVSLNRKRSRNANVDSGTGNGNYVLTIPLLNLPGRGSPLTLSLYYNSLLWQQTSTTPLILAWNHDHDWPAPGWSLGFGQMYQAGSSAYIIQDPDGTRHTCVGKNTWNSSLPGWNFAGKTNDGTLIDCQATLSYSTATLQLGRVLYPNGTTVDYGVTNTFGDALYPTRITDANGNYITVGYRNNSCDANTALTTCGGPWITSVTDTLGRTITFVYDSNWRLTSIAAPGLGVDGPRTVARFHYGVVTLKYAFPPVKTVPPNQGSFFGIDAIFFPGDATGYWFADADSYSSYGMIAKVSRRRAMAFTPGSSNEQGTISAGTMTDERQYNYPTATVGGPGLSQAPTYTKMTESWAGMDTAPAVTTYSLQKSALFQVLTTTYPDGARSYAYTYTDPTDFKNGLVYDQLIDGGTPAVLSQTQITYEKGDYNSPRVKTIQTTNARGQSTSTVFTYCNVSPNCLNFNQVTDIQNYDYDGKTVLKTTHVDYVTDQNYTYNPGSPSANRHILNLPNHLLVSSPAGALSETFYAYDGQPLAETPSVTNFSDSFDPQSPSYDKNTAYRGNITEIQRVTNPGNPHPAGPLEDCRYDITGNLISSTLGVSHTTYVYTQTTDYAYPEIVTQGPLPGVKCIAQCSISQAFSYDYNTGLSNSSTNADGRTTNFLYDHASLRPRTTTFSTNASETFLPDDVNMQTTATTWNAGSPPQLATQTVTTRNGLGLPVSVQSLADGNVWNVTATQYDAMGRVAKTSLPYRAGSSQPAWTSFTYDALGRLTMRQTGDGSQFRTFYDEANRPSSASASPGETVRSQDPWGRERWYRLDALSNLAEVVEPNPNSSGAVFDPGDMLTSYSFDALGRLTKVSQGGQIREFQYEGLGNLTAEYLPEKSRSLDTNGIHVSTGAVWSDVFSYDNRSNLVSHTDARGVTTSYLYGGDSLDRLHRITYDLTAVWDANNPITPIPNVTINYVQSGDIRKTAAVYMPQSSNSSWCEQDYSYDVEGRLSSKASACKTGQPLAIDYGYDSLSRITSRTYPVEYGTQALARRVVSSNIGIGALVTSVKVDDAFVASQVQYDPSGPVSSLVMGEGNPQSTLDTFSFDPNTGRLGAQTVKRGATDLLDLTYGYLLGGKPGTTGQLTSLIDDLDSKRQRGYQYDAVGRLTTVQDPPYWSTNYQYDRYGNRTGVTVTGKAADGSAIPPDGSPALQYDPATNHISTPGFSYDAAGDVTRSQRPDGSWLRYRYDAAGHLAAVLTDTGAVLESYSYAADGHRLMTNNPAASGRSTYFAWDGDQKIAEYHPPVPGGDLLWASSSVYMGGRLLATLEAIGSGNLVRYRHTDRLGSARLITNNANSNASMQVTLPFGTLLLSESSSTSNPIFTSYERSSATGQDYAVNRFYDSKTRFLSVDPLEMITVSPSNPQSLNLYTYVGNDPVNATDTTGTYTYLGMLKGTFGFTSLACYKVAAGCGPLGPAAGAAAGAIQLAETFVGPDPNATATASQYWSGVWKGLTAITSISSLDTRDWMSFGTPVTMQQSVDYPGSGITGVLTSTTIPVTVPGYTSPVTYNYTVSVENFSDGTVLVQVYAPGGNVLSRTGPDGSQTTASQNEDGSWTVTQTNSKGDITARYTTFGSVTGVIGIGDGGIGRTAGFGVSSCLMNASKSCFPDPN